MQSSSDPDNPVPMKRLRPNPDPSSKITAVLEEQSLWEEFHLQTNEMIVTKSGRRMFPVIKMNLRGLECRSFYTVVLGFKQIGSNRWKYINGKWLPGGKSEPAPRSPAYIHPDSPNYGCHWEKEPINFQRIKLTNKPCNSSKDKIMLNSLHKYEPQIHVFKVNGLNPTSKTLVSTVPYPTTQFIAVTAYQNEDVTFLKIKHNPFAKAFQPESSKSRATEEWQRRRQHHLGPYQQQQAIAAATATAATAATAAAVHRPPPYQLRREMEEKVEGNEFGQAVKREPYGDANWANQSYDNAGFVWNGGAGGGGGGGGNQVYNNQGFSHYAVHGPVAFQGQALVNGASPQISPANSSTATTSSFGSEGQCQYYQCQTSPSNSSVVAMPSVRIDTQYVQNQQQPNIAAAAAAPSALIAYDSFCDQISRPSSSAMASSAQMYEVSTTTTTTTTGGGGGGGNPRLPTPPDDQNDRHIKCEQENQSHPNPYSFPDVMNPQPIVLEPRASTSSSVINSQWQDVLYQPNQFN